jgi:hypothetical protein
MLFIWQPVVNPLITLFTISAYRRALRERCRASFPGGGGGGGGGGGRGGAAAVAAVDNNIQQQRQAPVPPLAARGETVLQPKQQ